MASSAGWFTGPAIFFVPFALRGLGGGDVKLLAALGAWVGPTDVMARPYTGVAGGLLALGTALTNGYLGSPGEIGLLLRTGGCRV